MVNSCPRITISGLGGDTGKTVISVGLCRLLRKKGLKVIPFKKGPDYIDMGWLSLGARHPCYNLDLFLMNKNQILFSFNLNTQHADIAVIEGNRGLYDGLDERGKVSTAELSKFLKSPVIIIVDCTKVTRTIAALVLGCQKLDPYVYIKGIVLNKVANPRQETVVRKSIEKYCSLPVVGAVPRIANIVFPGRHLGLVPPQEHPFAEKAIDTAGQIVEKYIDLKKLWKIAQEAQPLLIKSQISSKQSLVKSHLSMEDTNDQCPMTNDQLKVGVIRDSAFQFYYTENLEAFKKAGARLIQFSALTDDLPSDLNALYIGGGFPETHAVALSENIRLRESIKRAVAEGLPVYAECGGLMYLSKELRWEGKSYPMVGIFPLIIGVSKKPQGHGYSVIEVKRKNPFLKSGLLLRGHEFHYSHVLNEDEIIGLTTKYSKGKDSIYFAFKMRMGSGIVKGMDGLCFKNVLATYTHLHAIGSKQWIKGVIDIANSYKNMRPSFKF